MNNLKQEATIWAAICENTCFWLSWAVAVAVVCWDCLRLGVIAGMAHWSVGPVGKWALILALVLMAVSRWAVKMLEPKRM